jgi:hypothetical protein
MSTVGLIEAFGEVALGQRRIGRAGDRSLPRKAERPDGGAP